MAGVKGGTTVAEATTTSVAQGRAAIQEPQVALAGIRISSRTTTNTSLG